MSALAALALSLGGSVLTYARSDSDGAEAETVVVYARSPTEVWVHKARTPCTNAAFVTGRLDAATGQAIELVGGSLRRDLTQDAFARLSRNADGRLEFGFDRDGRSLSLSAPAGPRWVQYDFDFSDLIAHPPAEVLAGDNLSFDLLLLLTGDAPTFRNLGRLDLEFEGKTVAGLSAYAAGGPALAGKVGRFWFGPDGVLVDAIIPLANHNEHRDFRLRLVDRAQGEDAWRERLARHWEGCPAAD